MDLPHCVLLVSPCIIYVVSGDAEVLKEGVKLWELLSGLGILHFLESGDFVVEVCRVGVAVGVDECRVVDAGDGVVNVTSHKIPWSYACRNTFDCDLWTENNKRSRRNTNSNCDVSEGATIELDLYNLHSTEGVGARFDIVG